MRLYLRLNQSNYTIPFNYQHYLTGALHKWIGANNEIHGKISLHTFSWLQNVKVVSNKGIKLDIDSYFFISAFDQALIQKILLGIIKDPTLFADIRVIDAQIVEEPVFSQKETFLAASPIFIKRRFDNQIRHITYNDPACSQYLTETMQEKLQSAGLSSEGLQIKFDTSSFSPRIKLVRYKEIENRVNICPVIIEGTPEQIGFAWKVGIGNSTGVGFGALK
jgi:CRISPR-associated endoribonuclease Cas6